VVRGALIKILEVKIFNEFDASKTQEAHPYTKMRFEVDWEVSAAEPASTGCQTLIFVVIGVTLPYASQPSACSPPLWYVISIEWRANAEAD
jgi:hypothetical protein